MTLGASPSDRDSSLQIAMPSEHGILSPSSKSSPSHLAALKTQNPWPRIKHQTQEKPTQKRKIEGLDHMWLHDALIRDIDFGFAFRFSSPHACYDVLT
jgi:hypothetical protein